MTIELLKTKKVAPPFLWPYNWPGHWSTPEKNNLLTIDNNVNQGFLELMKSFGNSSFYFAPVPIEMMKEYYLKRGLQVSDKIVCAFKSTEC